MSEKKNRKNRRTRPNRKTADMVAELEAIKMNLEEAPEVNTHQEYNDQLKKMLAETADMARTSQRTPEEIKKMKEKEDKLPTGYGEVGEIVRKGGISEAREFDLPDGTPLSGTTHIDDINNTHVFESENGNNLLVLCTSGMKPYGIEYFWSEKDEEYVENGATHLDHIKNPWGTILEWIISNTDTYTDTTPTLCHYRVGKKSAMDTFLNLNVTPLWFTNSNGTIYAEIRTNLLNFCNACNEIPFFLKRRIDGPHHENGFDFTACPDETLNLLPILEALKTENEKNRDQRNHLAWYEEIINQAKVKTNENPSHSILHYTLNKGTIAEKVFHDAMKHSTILYTSTPGGHIYSGVAIVSPVAVKVCEMLMEMCLSHPDLVTNLTYYKARSNSLVFDLKVIAHDSLDTILKTKGCRLKRDKNKDGDPQIVAPRHMMGMIIKNVAKTGLLEKVGLSKWVAEPSAKKPSRKKQKKMNSKGWQGDKGTWQTVEFNIG